MSDSSATSDQASYKSLVSSPETQRYQPDQDFVTQLTDRLSNLSITRPIESMEIDPSSSEESEHILEGYDTLVEGRESDDNPQGQGQPTQEAEPDNSQGEGHHIQEEEANPLEPLNLSPNPPSPPSPPDPDNNPEFNMANAKPVKIPEFNPDDRSLPAKAWIRVVERCQLAGGQTNGQNNISDAELASKAIIALRGDAALWSSNTQEEGRDPDPFRTWQTFKEVFLERFHKKATLGERAEMMKGLFQKEDETVLAFLDRVKQAYFILYENWPAPTEANANADKLAKTKSFEMHACQTFINGLKDDIRKGVITQGGDTLTAILPVAQRVEASIKDKKVKHVSAIHQEDDIETEKEVNFVFSRPRGQARRGRGPARRGQSRGRRPAQPFRARFNGTCDWCNVYGHKRQDCFRRINEEQRNRGAPRANRPPLRQAAQVDTDQEEPKDVNALAADLNAEEFFLNPFAA